VVLLHIDRIMRGGGQKMQKKMIFKFFRVGPMWYFILRVSRQPRSGVSVQSLLLEVTHMLSPIGQRGRRVAGGQAQVIGELHLRVRINLSTLMRFLSVLN